MTTSPPASARTAAPSLDEVAALYARPLLELVFEAARVHREHNDPRSVQCASLLSVKTGGCPEDCGYCPQSAHHDAAVEPEPLMDVEQVLAEARAARDRGADRFCLGAAWRSVREGPALDRLIEMVKGVKALGLETCVTAGMLDEKQAARFREAGLDYYNHNLDTSREFYGEIIHTRTYDERLQTLQTVRDAGLHVCCGGILGMGEGTEDRIALLHALASLEPPPESVPINALVPVEGTPLAERPRLPWDELVRAIATARILMPTSRVRLSAGRDALSEETQAICFLAGADSIFLGERLLTAANREPDRDAELLRKLGLTPVAEAHVDGDGDR